MTKKMTKKDAFRFATDYMSVSRLIKMAHERMNGDILASILMLNGWSRTYHSAKSASNILQRLRATDTAATTFTIGRYGSVSVVKEAA